MKLAVAGAGSAYAPELVDGLMRMHELLPVSELALVDTDERRREIFTAVTRRMFEREGQIWIDKEALA